MRSWHSLPIVCSSLPKSSSLSFFLSYRPRTDWHFFLARIFAVAAAEKRTTTRKTRSAVHAGGRRKRKDRASLYRSRFGSAVMSLCGRRTTLSPFFFFIRRFYPSRTPRRTININRLFKFVTDVRQRWNSGRRGSVVCSIKISSRHRQSRHRNKSTKGGRKKKKKAQSNLSAVLLYGGKE